MNSTLLPLRNDFRTWLAFACLIGLLSALCFGSLSEHLLLPDDEANFRDNVATGRNFSYFFLPPDQKEMGSGRPVAELVKFLVYLAVGNDPAWFHMMVVAGHALASLLLARLAWRLGMSLELSMGGALLFLVEVAHFEAVYWISALDYPLALIWCLAALLCYRRYLDSRRFLWLCCWGSGAILGIMSHISAAMVLPFAFYWSWQRERDLKAALYRLLPLGLLLLPLLFFLVGITSQQTSTWRSIALYEEKSAFDAIFEYWRMLLWLLSRLLTTAHWIVLPVYVMQTWELFLGGALLAALGGVIWRNRGREKLWAAWIPLFSLPFVFLTEKTILDVLVGPSRYVYIASAGASVLLAWAIHRGAAYCGKFGRYLYLGALGLLIASSYVYLKRAEALSLYVSGRHYIAEGQIELGIDQLERAVATDRGVIDLEDAYTRLGMLFAFRRLDEFEPFVKEGLKACPKSPNLLIYRLILISMDAGSDMAGEAHQQLRATVENFPESADLIGRGFFNLGLGLTAGRQYDRAVLAYERSLEFLPDRVKTLKYLGLVLLSAGDSRRAAELLQRALQRAPSDHAVIYATARAFAEEERLEEAIDLCRRGLEIHTWAEPFFLLGECFEQTGRDAEARDAFREGLALDPDNYLYHLHLADLLIRMGDRGAAIPVVERAVQLRPEIPTLHLNLGKLLLLQGERRRAMEAYERVVELGGGSVEVYRTLERLYEEEGLGEKLVPLYRRLLADELEGADSGFYTRVGIDLFVREAVEDAVRAYRMALERDAGNTSAQINLGWCFYAQGALDEAVEQYLLALESGPSSAAQFNLGLALLAGGDIAAAREAYGRGVDLFGAVEGARIGAVDDLRDLIDRGVQIAEGREILSRFWPE